jgi:2-oxoglutarate ferredoxin oxidoreductase subunit alpha
MALGALHKQEARIKRNKKLVITINWCKACGICVAYAPSSVPETYDLTVKAINTAEMLRTPVFLLSDAMVGHMREAIDLPDPAELELIRRVGPQPDTNRQDFAPYRVENGNIPPMARFGDGLRFHIDSNVHDEYGFPATERHDVAEQLIRRLKNKVDSCADELIVVEEDRLAEAMKVSLNC